jgi:hypothetical protein
VERFDMVVGGGAGGIGGFGYRRPVVQLGQRVLGGRRPGFANEPLTIRGEVGRVGVVVRLGADTDERGVLGRGVSGRVGMLGGRRASGEIG